MYFCKDVLDEGIASDDGRVKFEVVHIVHEESLWGWLEYTKDKSRGDGGLVVEVGCSVA